MIEVREEEVREEEVRRSKKILDGVYDYVFKHLNILNKWHHQY
uniref:Uncharacterized protein n=1 Tax=viral metagenome TaxID=1070528 RepID=A0A6C0E599_9ZZZZ